MTVKPDMDGRAKPVAARVWHFLEATRLDSLPVKMFRWSIVGLILLNALAIVLESFASLKVKYETHFYYFELVSVAIFSIEYLARLATCTSDDKYRHPITGRLRWMTQPMSIIDIVAILPFFLPMFPIDLRFIRVLRVLRVLRITRMGRFSSSLTLTFRVFHRKRQQLFSALVVMSFWVFLASCVMYHFEHKAQPVAFGSIPQTLWWAVVTLTTIGYGDVYPITTGGKVVSCFFALIAIGIVALPTGILSSGFVEEFERAHDKITAKKNFCPNCGEKL